MIATLLVCITSQACVADELNGMIKVGKWIGLGLLIRVISYSDIDSDATTIFEKGYTAVSQIKDMLNSNTIRPHPR
ncbi:MAG: hypothetical protein M3Y53_01400 [Thermoproteota archaeon]|nr:hypothetical protein [Thermoproteota archaeon]